MKTDLASILKIFYTHIFMQRLFAFIFSFVLNFAQTNKLDIFLLGIVLQQIFTVMQLCAS